LAELVVSGELPPIEERLPVNPMIIQPVERVGIYGGTWRMGVRGYTDITLVRRIIQYEPLVRWNPTWRRVILNVAQSFEVNDNTTEFTFRLREGM
jgi:peptide/nickel transport system substrate-binding protein